MLQRLAITLAVFLCGGLVYADDAPRIQNGPIPRDGVITLQLQELWRAGGPNDEDMLFGLVTDVGGDADGDVYVFDGQLCHVQVYDGDGRHLRTLFREGEGPGETQNPRAMVMLPDHRVGLVQEYPGKIVIVDREGIPQESIIPGSQDPTRGGWYGLIMAMCRGGHLVCTGEHPMETDRPNTQGIHYFLASFAVDGTEEVRYFESQNVRDYTNFVFSERNDTPAFWWGSTVGPDGRVYTITDRDQYAISVFGKDGTLERIIAREYDLWKRTPEEFERMRLLYDSAIGGISIPYSIAIEEYEPAISYWHRGLRVDDEGQLWVVSSRGIREQPEGIMLTYDVFDSQGRFVRQVAVPCEGDGVDDALFFLGRDRVVLVKGYLDSLAAQFGRGTAFSSGDEEHTVPEVVCYRIL